MVDPLPSRLHHGDIATVAATRWWPDMVGWLDLIHWSTNPVWASVIDVDTGQQHSIQIQYVIGKMDAYDPAPRAMPEAWLGQDKPEDPPEIGVVLAS